MTHINVWHIAPQCSQLGYKCYVTFIDDHPRFTWICVLHFKSKVFSTFKKLHAVVETQFDKNIKVLRFDSREEYLYDDFSSFLLEKGIIHQKFCRYTPQQNGVAKVKNRHVLETVRALLIQSKVLFIFRCEAVHTTIHLIYRLPTPVLNNISPFESLYKKSPTYSHICTFGYLCFVHLPSLERHILSQ